METKFHKDIGVVPLMFEDEEILDRVMELYGQFKSRWQIRDILTKELELEEPISIITVGILIGRAKVKIREGLKTEPQDYKGRIIYCLEIILGGKAKYKDKLKALEMLAVYTGVEQATREEPSEYARRVCEAIKAADTSVDGIPRPQIGGESNEQEQKQSNKTQRDGQEEQEGATQSSQAGTQTHKE